MAEKESIDVMLRRILVLSLIVLLAASTYFLRELAITTSQINLRLESNSQEIDEVVEAAARISTRINSIDERLRTFERKVEEAFSWNEVSALLGEAGTLADHWNTNDSTPSLAAEVEIQHLLSTIRNSGFQFGYSDEIKSGKRFYFSLWTKLKVFSKSISSAEEFIERVASHTISGKQYFVIVEEGEKRPLASWLKEVLERFRQKEEGSSSENLERAE